MIFHYIYIALFSVDAERLLLPRTVNRSGRFTSFSSMERDRERYKKMNKSQAEKDAEEKARRDQRAKSDEWHIKNYCAALGETMSNHAECPYCFPGRKKP